MDKYMAAWNTVSKQYVARIQQESQRGSGGMF
jgi:import inner membrane translocase subunit TIM13